METLGLSLTLKNPTYEYTKNARWFAWDGGSEVGEMSLELRQGGYDTLNIYFVGGTLGGGRATAPVISPTADRIATDGLWVSHLTLPGAGGPPFAGTQYWNQGKVSVLTMPLRTATTNASKISVHEAGHWFGLDHTHERDGCLEQTDGHDCHVEGDRVCDTNPSFDSPRGCPGDPEWTEQDLYSCESYANGFHLPDPYENPM